MSDIRATFSDAQRQLILASFARQGFLQGMHARIARLEAGHCSIEIPFSPAVSQQHGFFHGGAIGALADTAGGYAAMTQAPEGRDVLTLEYKINFIRPGSGQLLVAEGEVLRAGRNITVTQISVHAVSDGRKMLCAAVQQSIILAPESR